MEHPSVEAILKKMKTIAMSQFAIDSLHKMRYIPAAPQGVKWILIFENLAISDQPFGNQPNQSPKWLKK
jgi:hypothetical protein